MCHFKAVIMTLESTKFIITVNATVQNAQKQIHRFLKKCQRKINSSISRSVIQNCQDAKRLEFGTCHI